MGQIIHQQLASDISKFQLKCSQNNMIMHTPFHHITRLKLVTVLLSCSD